MYLYRASSIAFLSSNNITSYAGKCTEDSNGAFITTSAIKCQLPASSSDQIRLKGK